MGGVQELWGGGNGQSSRTMYCSSLWVSWLGGELAKFTYGCVWGRAPPGRIRSWAFALTDGLIPSLRTLVWNAGWRLAHITCWVPLLQDPCSSHCACTGAKPAPFGQHVLRDIYFILSKMSWPFFQIFSTQSLTSTCQSHKLGWNLPEFIDYCSGELASSQNLSPHPTMHCVSQIFPFG